MSHWTLADVRAVQARHAVAVPPRRKFGNSPVTIDGHGFDSKKEGEHYLHLKMRLRLDEITDLELQPVFQLYVHPERVLAHFTPDFRYWERVPPGYVPAPRERLSPDHKVLRVVDVKSKATRTDSYILRKKWCEDLHKVTIMEVY